MAMKKAGMTDAEIQQVLLDDKAVDRGQVMEWDLSPEEHKKAMKYANSDEKKKKTAENGEKFGCNWQEKERKPHKSEHYRTFGNNFDRKWRFFR